MEKIGIVFEDGTKIELESAFVSGILADFTKAPMGMYAGKMDVGEMGFILTHLLRAVVKLGKEEHNMSGPVLRSFLTFCCERAIEIEDENKPEHNKSLQEHELYIKMMKDKKE